MPVREPLNGTIHAARPGAYHFPVTRKKQKHVPGTTCGDVPTAHLGKQIGRPAYPFGGELQEKLTPLRGFVRDRESSGGNGRWARNHTIDLGRIGGGKPLGKA